MAVDVGSAVGYLDLNISGFLAGLKQAHSEADRQTKNIVTTVGTNMSKVGQKFTSVGNSLTKSVTVPLATIGTVGLKTASDFEAGMSKVKAISQATEPEFKALRQEAIKLGADTVYSANEVAEAMTEMAKAGWTSQDILDGMSGVLDAAAASGENLATVSTIVADAISGFGLKAKDATHVADLLSQAANAGTIDINDLGESFKYIAPVAQAYGMSIEDVTTALLAMSKAGIKGSQAGTSLRTLLVNMAKPTETMQIAMDKLGVSLYDTNGKTKDLNTILAELRKGVQGLTEEEKNWALATLAGKTGLAGLSSLLNLTQEEYDALSASMANCDGIAKQTAETMQDNLKGKTEQLTGALESLAITLADYVFPWLTNFVIKLTEMVEKFTSADERIQKFILVLAGIAAAAGPVFVVLGKLTTGLGSVVTTLGKMHTAFSKGQKGVSVLYDLYAGVKNVGEAFNLHRAGLTGFAAETSKLGTMIATASRSTATFGGSLLSIGAPIAAAVAIIGTLVAAFKHLWDTNEGFRTRIIEIWTEIKEVVSGFLQGIVDRINALGFDFENITEVIKAIWDGFCNYLAPIFEGAFEKIKIVLETVLGVITGIFDIFVGIFTGNWEQVWTGVKEVFTSIWNGIKDTFVNIWNTIQGVLDTVFGWFGGSWNDFWNKIKDFFTNIWNNIVSFFKGGLDTAEGDSSGFISRVSNFFSQLPGKIKEHVTNTFNRVKEWGSNMLTKAKEVGKGFLDGVVDFFKSVPTKIGDFITSAWENVRKWGGDMLNKAKEVGKEFLSSIVSFFTEIPIKIGTFISDALKKVGTWVTDMVKKAGEIGDGFLGKIVEFFGAIPTKIGEFIGNALDKVKGWASDMGKEGSNAGSNVTNNVSSSMGNLASTVKTQTDAATKTLNSWVTTMGQKGTQAVNALVDAVEAEESNVKNSCKPIGKAIVDGVWAGMQNAKPQFEKDVRNYFADIVADAKDELDINSPSKVMENEIGSWLPPGVSKGFKKSMPQATKEMQTALSKSINELSGNEIQLGAVFAFSSFSGKLKNAYEQVAVWFESVESRINKSIDSMTQTLANLIYAGKLIYNPDGTIGYIPFGGFGDIDPPRKRVQDNETSNKKSGGGDTFNFYSPEPIDEIEAARQMKKTKRDMAEGF